MPLSLVQVGVLGTPALTLFLIGLVASRGRRPALAALLGILALAATVFLGWRWNRSSPCEIRVDTPSDGDSIAEPWATIAGVVSPQEARVFVLVHPSRSDQWWVQRLPTRAGAGAWKSEVNLGDAQAGRGEYFQILVVASTNPRFIDAVRLQLLTEGTAVERPPALPSSALITIWRAR
jgi:hypothetical protein